MKRFHLMNSKGISVLFLVIAMMLMITIGYVFSYLIPSKQKSVIFPIQSTQAFFLAQSGVEYAIRYATVQGWLTSALLANLNGAAVRQRNLGSGRFTITYTNTAPDLDTLFSVGEVPSGTEKRRITVTNFSSFLRQLVLWIDPNATPARPAPCLFDTTGGYYYEARFWIMNVGSTSLTLNSFRATWDPRPVTDPPINRVRFGGTTRYNQSYSNGGVRTYFNVSNQTITAGTTIQVRIRFADLPSAYNFSSLVVYLYDTNNNMYTFILDPDHDGLPSC
ncbi:MAG: hypothetical protein QME83_06515 [Thermodesulfobacteriota bacterium]|nr:hypothetical protein [Thermodesulfobacteriota bacterium]